MTVKEMLINELKRLGADGLCYLDDTCGCTINDLAPCMGEGIIHCEAEKAIKMEDMSESDRAYCKSEGIDALLIPLNSEYNKEDEE